MTEQCVEDDLVVPTLLRVETSADIVRELDEINATIGQLEKQSMDAKREAAHVDTLLTAANREKTRIQARYAKSPWIIA